MADFYERHRQRTIAKLAHGDHILDIGCADRPNAYLRARRVTGLDRNEMVVKPPYTEHIVGDIADIGVLLPNQQFDTVLMGELIEHIERPYDLLRSIRSHIVPGGSLILSTPNPLGIPVVLAEYLCLRRFYYTPHHVFYFTPRWVWRLLERTGYRVTRTIGCGASIAGFWLPAPARLSYIVIYVANRA